MSDRWGAFAEWFWDAVSATISVVGALFLAVAAQVLFLPLFYDLVPGRKTMDGPIFVVFAYVFAVAGALAVYALTRRRSWPRQVSVLIAMMVGPAIMIPTAAFCAWAARAPG
jgi:hypothetical protein